MNKKGFKTTFYVVILLVVGLLSITTYGIWDNLSDESNENIYLGEGTNIIVNISELPTNGKKLVPIGANLGPNDLNEVVLTYNVKLSKQTVNDLNLSVTATNLKIGDSSVETDLINIDIEKSNSVVNNSDVLVTVRVTMNEPLNQEDYEQLYGQNITFDLVFSAYS